MPLYDGDPLPPDHDRLVSASADIDAIFRAERSGLLRFVTRRAETQRAEDIVQEVFSRLAARSPGDVAAIEAPRAYLYRAARNLISDEARVAVRRQDQGHVSIDEVAISSGDPVAQLEARDRLARIEAGLLKLKPLTRQIFLACRLDGYSYAEIARQTGLSVRGVEKQMSRAIKQLGRHLRRHD